jgi:hypothetical protein
MGANLFQSRFLINSTIIFSSFSQEDPTLVNLSFSWYLNLFWVFQIFNRPLANLGYFDTPTTCESHDSNPHELITDEGISKDANNACKYRIRG